MARPACRRRLLAVAKPRAPRSYQRLVDDIQTALTEQTVTVPGTRAAELVLPKLATGLARRLHDRDELGTQLEDMLDAHPLAAVLRQLVPCAWPRGRHGRNLL